jgi:lysophospholipase L1-like esterase
MRKKGKRAGTCRTRISKTAVSLGVLTISMVVLSAQIVAGAQTVCYGDSITYSRYAGVFGIYPDTLNESLLDYYGAPQEVINEGHGSWTSSDGSDYVDTVIANYTDMDRVCLMFGTNDASVWADTPLPVYESNIGYMIDEFQAEGIEVILGILPPVCNDRVYQRDRVLELNEKIRELALEKEVYIADTSYYFGDTWNSTYFYDCLHPNITGYEILGNTSFFLPIVDSHRLHNGYNLLSTNTIVANDNVEEINVRATTGDMDRVNIDVITYNPTQFTVSVDGATYITLNMTDGVFEILPLTEYYVQRDGLFYQNVDSTLEGYLTFSVDLSNPPNIIDVYQARAYIPPDPTDLQYTRTDYLVHYSWFPGPGNVSDSYYVSMNGAWTNGTPNTYKNIYVDPSGWANISVFAYNASGGGSLSAGCVSDEVQAHVSPAPTPTPTPEVTPTPIPSQL